MNEENQSVLINFYNAILSVCVLVKGMLMKYILILTKLMHAI